MYPKAVDCLAKDRVELPALCDFPVEHRIHLRTINPIESSFTTARHRTDGTKGCVTHDRMLAMIYRLGVVAERSWKQLRGIQWLVEVIQGVKLRDGSELREEMNVRTELLISSAAD